MNVKWVLTIVIPQMEFVLTQKRVSFAHVLLDTVGMALIVQVSFIAIYSVSNRPLFT